MSKAEEDCEALLRQLQDSVDAHPDDPSLYFDLGLLLWEKGGESKEIKEKAAEHFLLSAKLNPQNGASFKYLGHYYRTVSVDAQRAVKCYQRAVSLLPDDFQSGEALCDILDEGGKEILEMSVCKEASEKSPKAFWAFKRLGYHQVHQKKWSEAVPSLQHAIRGYPTCADLWEALGLAYQRLGMFTAALKSYGRAIELEDSRVFALIESGNISLMLGSFRTAVEQFQRSLEILSSSVSAQYGLASALLGLAKECINLGASRWGASLLEEASMVAKASTLLVGNMSCIWKLHGDIQLLYAKCFPWVESEVNAEAFSASILSWKKICHLAAFSARSSYQRALQLAPWQANIYADIAVTCDLISSFDTHEANDWQLSEKMALGALLLEGDNYEFWVALGCVSGHGALKQHALLRGLQLDVSLAIAWAYLGKLYREKGEKQLARQAFDCSRSIDPSLALPWAGMSADFLAGKSATDEAFENCLRAVQILPLAEFQMGLAKLALHSGNLSSPLVFGAIKQAVQHAPHYPEAHNLNGLACEAQSDYQSAVYSYRLARYAITMFSGSSSQAYTKYVSLNLARSLCLVGNAVDAIRECEELKKEGMLEGESLQIYAFSLWQLGKSDQALSVARSLAASVSRMERKSAAASVSFICRLLYHISGLDSAIISILKMPKVLFQSSKVSFVVSAIHALDQSNRLESVVSSSSNFVVSHDEVTGMHVLIALGKLVKHGSEHCLALQSGVTHLRKSLHLYPNSTLLRNLLGYLLVHNKEWNDAHVAARCCVVDAFDSHMKEGLKSACEILGAGGVACYAIANNNPLFSFPTCEYQCLTGSGAIKQLQKSLRQEPWNHNVRYLLVLNFLQKAREERFPRVLCRTLERLILISLSTDVYSKKDACYQYQKFQLLLCAAEISLQNGKHTVCVNHAKTASSLTLPNSYLFFAHLLLCRVYATLGNFRDLREEYVRCLELKTEYHIGWLCLKFMESQYGLLIDSNNTLELGFMECSEESTNSWKMWMAVFNLVQGLMSIWNQDFPFAADLLAQACSLANSDSCLLLCYGNTCMELARQGHGSKFLSLALKSLSKAQESSVVPLPFVSALIAQAEGSLGSKEKWERNLCLEWFTWPPEMRPAELFFQMHLLARQIRTGDESSLRIASCQTPQKWVLRAIHVNPSCMKYWKVLQQLME